jgi:hypothetical protein
MNLPCVDTEKISSRVIVLTLFWQYNVPARQWRCGTLVFFWGGGTWALLFRQTVKIFRQTKKFSGQHFK